MNSDSNQLQEMGSTDHVLITNVQKDSSEDWNMLVQKYTPLVFNWCKKSGFDSEDASDITQNVFVSVYKSIHTFKNVRKPYSFRSWLWKITRFRICDYLKANWENPKAVGGTDMNKFLNEQPVNDLLPDETSKAALLQKQLLIAMARVSTQVNEQSWTAFELLSFESMSYKEVAEKLGMSQPAIRMIKSRILKKLKEEIQLVQDEMTI